MKRVICTATLLNVQFPASFAPSNGKEFTEEDWSEESNPVLGVTALLGQESGGPGPSMTRTLQLSRGTDWGGGRAHPDGPVW